MQGVEWHAAAKMPQALPGNAQKSRPVPAAAAGKTGVEWQAC